MMEPVDWKARHPFTRGQVIFAVGDLATVTPGEIIAAGSAVSVWCRGCNDGGNWVCLRDYPGSLFPVSSFRECAA